MTSSAMLAVSGWTLGLGAWMGLASVVAFVTHGLDKRSAMRGRRRVPEARLHLMELIGGWPGALVAMGLFHHKVRKPSYLVITLGIMAVWIVIVVWVVSAD
jgi:uncharacterized membrane protein YsdA (DUF1294 family)